MLWRDELAKLNIQFDLAAIHVDVRLEERHLERLAKYRATFNGVRDAVKALDLPVNREEGGLSSSNEASDESLGDAEEPSGVVARVGRGLAKFGERVGRGFWAIMALLGYSPHEDDEDSGDGNAVSNSGEASAAAIESASLPPTGEKAEEEEKRIGQDVRERLLLVVNQVIAEAGKAEELLSAHSTGDDEVGGDDRTRSILGHLDVLRQHQIALIDVLNEQDKYLLKSTYHVLTDLYEILSVPAEYRALLESQRRMKAEDVMRNRGEEFAVGLREAWRGAERAKDARLLDYESSKAYGELRGIWRELEEYGTLIGGRVKGDGENDICSRLEEMASSLKNALETFPSEIDGLSNGPIDFLPRESSSLTVDERHALAGMLERARGEVSALVQGTNKAKCLWPDRDRRDEVSYNVFFFTFFAL